MARLWTVLAWFFTGLAVNLAILCPLATPQQARADDYDCSCCESLIGDPMAYTACYTNCQNAFNAACGTCACQGGQLYTDCMNSCLAGGECAGSPICDTPRRKCSQLRKVDCPSDTSPLARAYCSNGSPTNDCSGCRCHPNSDPTINFCECVKP